MSKISKLQESYKSYFARLRAFYSRLTVCILSITDSACLHSWTPVITDVACRILLIVVFDIACMLEIYINVIYSADVLPAIGQRVVWLSPVMGRAVPPTQHMQNLTLYSVVDRQRWHSLRPQNHDRPSRVYSARHCLGQLLQSRNISCHWHNLQNYAWLSVTVHAEFLSLASPG
jgi:hypothetical protein